MTSIQRFLILFWLSSLVFVANAFAPSTSEISRRYSSNFAKPLSLQAAPIQVFEATSTNVAAATLDPTTFLSDLLGAFINSNLILAVPIVAALAVAALVAFGIVAYANPAESEDD
jgi:ABC-type glycerol-3-phosphate transport system permease component